jgi:hypothetical protein
VNHGRKARAAGRRKSSSSSTADPDRLDADHDGIACEDNPAPYYFKDHLP